MIAFQDPAAVIAAANDDLTGGIVTVGVILLLLIALIAPSIYKHLVKRGIDARDQDLAAAKWEMKVRAAVADQDFVRADLNALEGKFSSLRVQVETMRSELHKLHKQQPDKKPIDARPGHVLASGDLGDLGAIGNSITLRFTRVGDHMSVFLVQP